MLLANAAVLDKTAVGVLLRAPGPQDPRRSSSGEQQILTAICGEQVDVGRLQSEADLVVNLHAGLTLGPHGKRPASQIEVEQGLVAKQLDDPQPPGSGSGSWRSGSGAYGCR